MKLLLTNDDGVFADGIYALAKELANDFELTVVAPLSEQSGKAHSFTFLDPLRVQEVYLRDNKISAYAVRGTPVDCVKLGIHNLVSDASVVVAGINHGSNMGSDILYSGTASAALEGMMLGVPSLAVSICAFMPKHLETAAVLAKRTALLVSKMAPITLNLNVPDVPLSEIRGIKLAKLACIRRNQVYVERTDPRGGKYYWLPEEPIEHDGTECDAYWIERGFATLTPLKLNLDDLELAEGLDLESILT